MLVGTWVGALDGTSIGEDVGGGDDPPGAEQSPRTQTAVLSIVFFPVDVVWALLSFSLYKFD